MGNLDAQKDSEHVYFFTRYSSENAPVHHTLFNSVWIFAFSAQWYSFKKKYPKGQIIVEN